MSAQPIPSPGAIAWTRFYDEYAPRKMDIVHTWADLVQHLRVAGPFPSKAACHWIKLAVFGNVATAKGSLRHDDNVLEVTGVEGDYDGEKIQPEAAVAMLEAAGVRACVYSSPSSKPEAPRWRVLAPLSRPHAPEARAALLARINGVLGGVLAAESFTLSQAFFYGRLTTPGDYRVLVTFDDPAAGQCVDELDELDDGAIGKPANVQSTGQCGAGGGSGPIRFTDAEAKVAALGRRLRTGDGRRALLMSYISSRSARGFDAAEIRALVGAFAETFFDAADPMDNDNVAAIIKWACERDAVKRRELERVVLNWRGPGAEDGGGGAKAPGTGTGGLEPDNLFEAPSIPRMDLRACLPTVVAEYAEAMGQAGSLDAGAYAIAALPVLAGATDRSVRINLGPTHTSSLVLWAALVGRTGWGKSPAMDAAAEPLKKMHADAVRQYTDEMAAWVKAPKDERGPEPALQARYLTDATIEAVVAKLGASKGPRLLRHADEGSGWLNAMGRYANGAGGDGERGTWLTAWVGPQPATVSRIGRGDVFVPEMGACLLMGITPEKMREGYREATGEGVLGRTLVYLLDPARNEAPGKPATAPAARRAYDELVRRVSRARGEMGLSFEAQDVYDARRREWRETMAAIQDVSPGLASVLAKANENLGRLALLFEIAGEQVGQNVGALAVARAGALMDYLLRHAVVAHQHLFTQDTVVGVAKALALKILRDGPQPDFRVERRVIGRTAAFEQADEPTRRAAIDYLAGTRWLLAPDTRRVRLGMRFCEATAWRANPLVYERFADEAERSRQEAERALAALSRLRGAA
jgi:hypothetical protein